MSIAIVGGGPAGLTLARILHIHGIAATVFERDLSPDDRPQGGTLDLHPESGQLALARAGLEEEFRKVARFEDQGTRVLDHHGVVHFADNRSDGDRPEVDRSELRHLLLASLPEETVRWDSQVIKIETQPDGRFSVLQPDRPVEQFDFVVGADGAWSKVRPLLSNAQPTYTGAVFYEFGLDDVDRQHPEIAALVGRGSMFALGEGRAIIGQRNGNAHIRICAALRAPESEIITFVDASSLETAKNDLLRIFENWSESLRNLISQGGNLRIWPLYTLPVGHRWNHRPGVTLIGDAAHLMTPFSGEGANLAMLDASELALAIALGKEIRDFESSMLARAEEAAFGATQGLESALAPDALAHTVAWMSGAVGR